MAKKKKKKFTPKQAMFCKEYLIDLNATQAAIRAGYSKKTAHVCGPRLLSNVRIAEKISKLKKQREKRVISDADRVILELKRLAFVDVRKLYDEYGNLKPIHELDDETAAAIGGINIHELRSGNTDEMIREYVKKVKMIDKSRALEMLMKHHDLFAPEKHELEGGITITVKTVEKGDEDVQGSDDS